MIPFSFLTSEILGCYECNGSCYIVEMINPIGTNVFIAREIQFVSVHSVLFDSFEINCITRLFDDDSLSTFADNSYYSRNRNTRG